MHFEFRTARAKENYQFSHVGSCKIQNTRHLTTNENFRSVLPLTLCIVMDSSFWFDLNKLGIVHCTYLGVSGYNTRLKIFLNFTDSVDPDEMQYYTAFRLGLHLLQNFSFRGI